MRRESSSRAAPTFFLFVHLLRAKPVADDNPVDRGKARLGPHLPGTTDHFGIDRRALDLAGQPVDAGQRSKSTKLSLSGVISVSARVSSPWLRRVWLPGQSMTI